MTSPTSIAEIDLKPIPGKRYWNCDREWREEFIYFMMVDRFFVGAVLSALTHPTI